ncbi:hypothetical protein BC943DRAFT_360088 [Umbelopsis sp. AD052]|nr:hypothetical protein BC943DRAFT_360088 [Umbelopsis sp. AD052]
MTTKDIYGQKKVREIETTSRNFPFDGIILSKDPEPEVSGQRNTIWRFLVADETGSIVMKIWGQHGEYLAEGDIVHLHDAEVRLFLGFPYLTLSRSGHVLRIGRDTFIYNDKPNRSEELRDANAQSTQGNVPYTQQQRMNNNGRPGGGKQAAINPAKFPQANSQHTKASSNSSSPFNPYQQVPSPVIPSSSSNSPRGGYSRGGRGDRGGKRGNRGRRAFRDRDQPDRPLPGSMQERPSDFQDTDSSVLPMKREVEDSNQLPRQRSRMNYEK